MSSTKAQGYDTLVEKTFHLRQPFKTINGQEIKNVKVGYETYGKLSANKDNVILLCHGSLNNSHFAGKYKHTDPNPGYWDHVIGPGNIIDTDRYYAIASDSLANVLVNDPHTITTGPASENLDNNKRYGMKFPIVTIADFVEIQKLLLDHLGISKLHTVMGASMGGMQALEWAARYPDMVERAIPVTAQAEQGPYNIELKDIIISIIKLDPNWHDGDYYDKKNGPEEGLIVAFKSYEMAATTYAPLERLFGRRWEEEDKNPAESWDNKFLVQAHYDEVARDRLKNVDANSWIYIAHALNLFRVGHRYNTRSGLAKIKAKVLFIFSKSDLLMFADFSKQAWSVMKNMGKNVDYFELDGDEGHSESRNIENAEVKLREFLK